GWPSPCGIATPGRPGWHIECSAMSWKHLGETFDIHGGGIDLVFPHHENEIAQSRCAFHTNVMANFWMHNGFLQVEGEKMSKSLGNFITIRELREQWENRSWPGETIRFNMLRTHYRQPIDWTFNNLRESHSILLDWYDKLKGVSVDPVLPNSLLASLSDDLNTPKAITDLHALNRKGDLAALLGSLRFLGFSGEREALHWTTFVNVGIAQETDTAPSIGVVKSPRPQTRDVDALIAARNSARAAKNFKEADRIRDELAAMGVVLKDTRDGTTWEIAR
ncbi:MAG: cysteine--tRNA ligase, partial [Alphaproteobacteria bacterium]|nr:cysteine--tRNA ligase [Alphaproteobacteria bacterium]